VTVDFKYHQKAAELDERLEAVMESHAEEAASSSDTPAVRPTTKQSGLQAFLDGQTVQDEMQAVLGRLNTKSAAEEIRTELARERMSEILEGRQEKLSSFLAETSAAVGEMNHHDPVAETRSLIRQGVDPIEAARRVLA
jgi:hypothetical protein